MLSFGIGAVTAGCLTEVVPNLGKSKLKSFLPMLFCDMYDENSLLGGDALNPFDCEDMRLR